MAATVRNLPPRHATGKPGAFLSSLVLAPHSPEAARVAAIRARLLGLGRPRLSIARARLFTAAWRAHDGLPVALRKAQAVRAVLEGMPVEVFDRQLLVGTPAAFCGAVEVDPEYHTPWLLAEVPGLGLTNLRALPVRPFMPVDVDPEDLRELEEDILPYWRERALGSRIGADLRDLFPQTADYLAQAGVFLANFGKGYSHTIPDYRTVVERGLQAVVDELRERRAGLLRRLDTAEDLRRAEFLQAMVVCAEAVLAHADRCALACEALAEDDPGRAVELRRMAAACRRAPRHAAESWHEVLQAVHLTHMATFLAEGGVSHSLGRMDVYLAPFHRRFVEQGAETPESAQELLACFFLKCYEFQSIRDARSAEGLAGDRTNDKITLGGTDAQGDDATTPLTWRFLEAQAHVRLKEPNLSLRVHRATPPALLAAALEVIRLGGGLPQLINDEVIVPALMAETGMALEHAREFADIGCQENSADPNGDHRADANGHNNGGFFNLLKVLELALWRGHDPASGLRPGPEGPDPRDIRDADGLERAYRLQLAWALDHYRRMNALTEHHYAASISTPYHGLMHPGPRTTGQDFSAGGCRYNWIAAVGVGLASTADSLMVVDELLLRRREVGWDELLEALAAGWHGHEALRERILALPRYGAGGQPANRWARRVAAAFAAECRARSIPRGGGQVRFAAGLFSMGIHLVLGQDVGATPDGRMAGEMLSGTVAPSRHARRADHFSSHAAAAGLDTARLANGVILNEVMAAGSVDTPADLAKWADLVRAYFSMGGMCVQYSVASREVLEEARREPQRHADLLVRVGGYSARFVELAPEIQDEFLARL